MTKIFSFFQVAPRLFKFSPLRLNVNLIVHMLSLSTNLLLILGQSNFYYSRKMLKCASAFNKITLLSIFFVLNNIKC